MRFSRQKIVNKLPNSKHKGIYTENHFINSSKEKRGNIKNEAPIKKIFGKNHNNENINIYDKNSYNISTKNNPIMNVYSGMYPKNNENYNFDLNKNNNIKNENERNLNNHHHVFHEIDMTNKNIMNSEQQNGDGGICDLNRYTKINNAQTYFSSVLRKYEKEYNIAQINNYYNKKNGKQNTNMALDKNRKTTICSKYVIDTKNIISQNNKNNENFKSKNYSKHKDVLKSNNFRNSGFTTRKSLSKNKTKQNKLNDINQKNVTKKSPTTSSIKKKNDKKITIKKNNLKVHKNEDFFIVYKNKHFDLNKVSKNENENFALNGKEEKKVFFEKKLLESFLLQGKKENDKILEYKNIDNIHLQGKEENIEIILKMMDQYNFSEDELRAMKEKINSKIETKKPKKHKLDENERKNANDNNLINIYVGEVEYNNNYFLNNNKENESNLTKKKKKEIERKLLEEKEREDLIICKKLYGFKNEGNNCYLNSSLQLLTRIKDLKDEVFNFNENYQDNETNGRLIIEFRNMLKIIENSGNDNLTLNPAKLKWIMGAIDNKYYSGAQEDSNEFITNFITGLLEETGNKEKKVKKLDIINEKEKVPYNNLYKKFYQRKGDSFIINLFYGISKVTKLCDKCGNCNSIKFNVYNMLDFQLVNLIKENSNKELQLKDLFDEYTRKIKCGDICSKCNKEEIYSKTSIYTLPKYLIISFGRSYDNNYFYNNILYPKTLKLKADFENNTKSYLLDCVIEHTGGSKFGHYTALVPIDKNNNKWVRISDSYCDRTPTGYLSGNAIILLYKLI